MGLRLVPIGEIRWHMAVDGRRRTLGTGGFERLEGACFAVSGSDSGEQV